MPVIRDGSVKFRNPAKWRRLDRYSKSTRSIAKKAKNKVDILYRGLDTHYLEGIFAASVSSTPQFTLLNNFSQGDDVVHREGNYSQVTKIKLWGNVAAPGSEVNLCRIILFVDKQASGIGTDASDFFQNSTTPALSNIFFDNKKRYRILWDKKMSIGASPDTLMFNYSKRFKKPIDAKYSGAGNTIADIMTNAIYMCVVSDSTVTGHPAFQINHSVEFIP